MKKKNKKIIYLIFGIVALVLVTIAVTYAYWLVTKTQSEKNVVLAKCFKISMINEKNDIELTNQFPMSDEEGMKLVPYEFTVTNNCNTSIDYQISLEIIGNQEETIKNSALKVALNDSVKLYNEYVNIDTTIEGAYESRMLKYSKLMPSGSEGSSVTYKLRIWIDADASISEMNKTFKSKISVTVGQEISNVYEEGTLAYDILTKYGGAGSANKIKADEYDHRVVVSGNLDIGNEYERYYGTEYIYDADSDKYTLSGNVISAFLEECRNGTKTCGKYMVNALDTINSYTDIEEITDFGNSGDYVTANKIKYTNEFGALPKENDANLYKIKDDLGDSYYFRGNVVNNYVKFGTYSTNNEVNSTIIGEIGDSMYWRIVRINGDGTIRLVYDGTQLVSNGTEHMAMIGTTSYSLDYNQEKYVGYTYDDGTGTQVDSTIKSLVDEWYNSELKSKYGAYISDGIFCNDKSVAEYKYYDSNRDATSFDNAVYTDVYYNGYNRLYSNYKPSLKCANKSDRYTVNDTLNGNGFLNNPVGLLSADEVILAGGLTSPEKYSYNNDVVPYYLYTGYYYWTLTPNYWSDGRFPLVWSVHHEGYLNQDSHVDHGASARPVINLKADVEYTGTGTIDDPYIIITE